MLMANRSTVAHGVYTLIFGSSDGSGAGQRPPVLKTSDTNIDNETRA